MGPEAGGSGRLRTHRRARARKPNSHAAHGRSLLTRRLRPVDLLPFPQVPQLLRMGAFTTITCGLALAPRCAAAGPPPAPPGM